ncbi:MAG: efflux RND transporter permease subunit, partial [Candidatus Hydrogenedentota bacterium]
MKITQYTVYRRLATSAIILALTVLGLYGFWRLPVDFLPDIEYPEVRVMVRWPGATPDEIDKNIADIIEREMATLDRLDSLESTAFEGMYELRIIFEYGADVDIRYQDALAALGRTRPDLPTDIEEPLVFKADPSQLPVMQLAVSSTDLDLVELREWSERWLNDQLVAVSGVAGTSIVGGQQREIRVLLDPSALEKHGIALNTVLNRIEEENLDRSAGRITSDRKEIVIRTTGEFQSLEEIRSILVAREGQAKVTLGDLATVEDG